VTRRFRAITTGVVLYREGHAGPAAIFSSEETASWLPSDQPINVSIAEDFLTARG